MNIYQVKCVGDDGKVYYLTTGCDLTKNGKVWAGDSAFKAFLQLNYVRKRYNRSQRERISDLMKNAVITIIDTETKEFRYVNFNDYLNDYLGCG